MPAMMILHSPKMDDPYCIPMPKGFKFDEDTEEDGMPIMVKVKPYSKDKIKIVEVEGEPVGGEVIENEKTAEEPVPYVPDTDSDGE